MSIVKWTRVVKYWRAMVELYGRNNPLGRGVLLPLEEVEKRYEICKACPHFTGLKCDLCGCCGTGKRDHFNKLAFPTEQCPDVPPRFNRWTDAELQQLAGK